MVLALVVLLGAAGCMPGYRISNSETNFPNVYVNGIDVGGLTKEETEQKLIDEGWGEPEHMVLRVELPMDVSFELDRGEAGLSMDQGGRRGGRLPLRPRRQHAGQREALFPRRSTRWTWPRTRELDRDYIRAKAEAAVEEFREKTSGESYSIETEKKVLHFVKGAGEMDLDLDALRRGGRGHDGAGDPSGL